MQQLIYRNILPRLRKNLHLFQNLKNPFLKYEKEKELFQGPTFAQNLLLFHCRLKNSSQKAKSCITSLSNDGQEGIQSEISQLLKKYSFTQEKDL